MAQSAHTCAQHAQPMLHSCLVAEALRGTALQVVHKDAAPLALPDNPFESLPQVDLDPDIIQASCACLHALQPHRPLPHTVAQPLHTAGEVWVWVWVWLRPTGHAHLPLRDRGWGLQLESPTTPPG